MTTKTQKRPAAKPESLELQISIPPQVVPLFKATAAIMDLHPQAFAVYAICKGMTCEDVLNKFDELVNAAL